MQFHFRRSWRKLSFWLPRRSPQFKGPRPRAVKSFPAVSGWEDGCAPKVPSHKEMGACDSSHILVVQGFLSSSFSSVPNQHEDHCQSCGFV